MSLQHSPPSCGSPNPDLATSEESLPRPNIGTRKRKGLLPSDARDDSSKELKKMLKDLQDAQDSKFEKLSAAIEANTLQNTNLLASNVEIQNLLLEYKKECMELKKKVANLESQCADSQNKINILEDQIKELQRFQKKDM